uniref:Uncharacterized protein n=1 Tax=Leersia perrieri TaxID=77586 RepID=A0A0D9VVQ6_9ORYZ
MTYSSNIVFTWMNTTARNLSALAGELVFGAEKGHSVYPGAPTDIVPSAGYFTCSSLNLQSD